MEHQKPYPPVTDELTAEQKRKSFKKRKSVTIEKTPPQIINYINVPEGTNIDAIDGVDEKFKVVRFENGVKIKISFD